MVKQSTKIKEPIPKKSISDFKKNFGFGGTQKGSIKATNADKEMEWLVMPKGFQDALKLPGIPCGYVIAIAGHTNVGKSTLVNHAIVAAQHKGMIPVIFDTENNFDWKYAINMGMVATPIYKDVEEVDDETGEIKTINKIVDYDGEFIYFNTTMLAEKYGNMNYSSGKEEKTFRSEAVIEDVARCVNELIKAQDSGEITQGMVFIWDSIGSIECYKSYASNVNNNMWNAGALSQAFNVIFNDRIPRTRKTSCPFTDTFIFINKVWMDSQSSPVGPPSISMKGGESASYSARLIILMGGQLKSASKRLTAISKGETYNYGIQVKIKVFKNQLPVPYNLTYESNVACTPYGLIGIDELDNFRKEHISEILNQLNTLINKDNADSNEVSEKDIEFVEEESGE
jgi:hypothetical protein